MENIVINAVINLKTHYGSNGWDVLNIVQTYQSDLKTCMVELWFEFSEYYPYIEMYQYNVPTKYQLQIPYRL